MSGSSTSSAELASSPLERLWDLFGEEKMFIFWTICFRVLPVNDNWRFSQRQWCTRSDFQKCKSRCYRGMKKRAMQRFGVFPRCNVGVLNWPSKKPQTSALLIFPSFSSAVFWFFEKIFRAGLSGLRGAFVFRGEDLWARVGDFMLELGLEIVWTNLASPDSFSK